jgi:hypothetical protein
MCVYVSSSISVHKRKMAIVYVHLQKLDFINTHLHKCFHKSTFMEGWAFINAQVKKHALS